MGSLEGRIVHGTCHYVTAAPSFHFAPQASKSVAKRQAEDEAEAAAKREAKKARLERRRRGHVTVPRKGEDPQHDLLEKGLGRLATRWVWLPGQSEWGRGGFVPRIVTWWVPRAQDRVTEGRTVRSPGFGSDCRESGRYTHQPWRIVLRNGVPWKFLAEQRRKCGRPCLGLWALDADACRRHVA